MPGNSSLPAAENIKEKLESCHFRRGSRNTGQPCQHSVLSIAFGLTHEQYVTLLPKSITTAIALGVSTELGGMAAVTSACVVITGILGNAIAETVLKLARIEDPIAKGLACGTSAHAIGTAKAMELGELEGAMSSLSICVAGLMTVLAATFFANLY